MKKVFIVSSILFFFTGSFYGAYYFFLKEGRSKEVNKTENIIGEKSDKKENGQMKKISKISDFRSFALSLDEEGGKIKYYNLDEKGFWLSSFDGSFKKKLSSDDFVNLKEVLWAKDSKKALLKIDDSYYIYAPGAEKVLIKKSDTMNWLNFDQEIAYTFEDSNTGKKTINVANPDGSGWKEVAELKNANLIMQTIPRSAKTAFWPKADSFVETEMMTLSAGGIDLEKKGDLKYGADYLWSTGGDKFLRSYVMEKGGNNLVLEMCHPKDATCVNLNFPTIVSKCVWLKDDKNIICAQIKNLDKSTVMPNDYWSKKFFSEDLFWKINTENMKKEKIVEEKDMEESIDAINLLLSPNEDFLFFINRRDDKLFRIIL